MRNLSAQLKDGTWGQILGEGRSGLFYWCDNNGENIRMIDLLSDVKKIGYERLEKQSQ